MVAGVHSESHRSDALPVCLGGENPHRLVSLWDIVKTFDAFVLAAYFQALVVTRDECGVHEGGAVVPVGLKDQAYSVMDSLSLFCGQHDFADAKDEINRVVIGLGAASGEDLDISTLKAKLGQVKGIVEKALREHKFLRIDLIRAKYLDAPALLGERVAISFKSAVPDIVHAGNCLAVELHTAAVFHLMRVAEHGLRALARTVGVKLKDKGKKQPIEFAEWDKVITAINNKISKAKGLSMGPKKSARLTFYSDAAERCSYLKELRNEVSHARKDYNSGEALGVMERIRGFMEFLEQERDL